MVSVVLLSGGLDSATALALEVEKWGATELLALTFDYGQRHGQAEIAAAGRIADLYGVPQLLWAIENCGAYLGGSLFGSAPLPDAPPDDPAQAATVVPARNLILLSCAAGLAISRGARFVVIGCNADDAAIYADCRPTFLSVFDAAVDQICRGQVRVLAPWALKPKREVAAEARRLGLPVEMTYSCYRGDPQPCGKCGACRARAEALE